MSVTVSVRLLHGSIRAMGRADAALMGVADESTIEWPPSPARIVSALVAGGGSSEWRRIESDDSEIRAFEAASAPVIVADSHAPDDLMVTRLVDRYVVDDANVEGIVQNYPARKSTESRPGVRVRPRNPELHYVWRDLELTPDQQRALRLRAARVGYLGTSDSPVAFSVRFNDSPGIDSERCWEPAEEGRALVSVPFPGMLDVLDRAYGETQEGRTIAGSTIARRFARYRVPGVGLESVASIGGTRLWLTFDRPLSGHRVLRVAEALKGLALDQFAPRGTPGEAPPVLTGHGVERGKPHARFWPLPFVGHRYANGRLFGACIWLPDDVDPALELRLRTDLDGAVLRVAGAPPVTLSVYDGSSPHATSRPETWEHESRLWASVAPVVWERFSTRGPTLDDVADWCSYEGLPRPVEVEVGRLPFISGGIDLRPRQATRAGRQPRPYGHLRVRFAEPVMGPFALGRLRSFGLGLMAPMPDRNDADGARHGNGSAIGTEGGTR